MCVEELWSHGVKQKLILESKIVTVCLLSLCVLIVSCGKPFFWLGLE